MFENTGSSNMDEAVIRVLDVLANVADITEPRNYIFDTKALTFKPRNKRTPSLKSRKYKIRLPT